jgi:lysophospholipase L1-like esterase
MLRLHPWLKNKPQRRYDIRRMAGQNPAVILFLTMTPQLGAAKSVAVYFALFAATCLAQNAFAAGPRWVGTWGCGPQLTEPGNLPPAPLADSTLRQFVHATLGGKTLRVRFSNTFGTNSVALASAHVALAASDLGGGEIIPATDKALTFHGAPTLVIQPGETVWSDPVAFDLPALANLAITTFFGDISATTITGHPGSRTTSFIVAGNSVSAAGLPDAKKSAHWYLVTGVDVAANAADKAVVVLGDSITDGRGSTTDGNNRWPDDFAARLQTNSATAGVAVLNMGIGGNGIFGGLGPSAVKRFDRDVLEQGGVRSLIIFEGVNDIGGAHGDRETTIATNLIAAYRQFIAQAHARNLRVYGATITPFGGSFYDSPAHETARQAVNDWIRTNNLCDAVIDFDSAVRDPAAPAKLLPAYDTGDHLHLNPAGYHAMADAIDLKLFAP